MEKDLTVKKTHESNLVFQDWGLVDYQTALLRQMDLVDLVSREHARETIVFCTHSPVVTLGRGTRDGDLCGWTGETVEVGRGGRATYHGPSQLVVYPILDMSQRGRDLHKYMRTLEEIVVGTLQDFGVTASGRSMQVHDGDEVAEEATGVWIGSRKIASIGIGVRKWVSFHGLAINLDQDDNAFQGMKPCGFTPSMMVSLEEVLGNPVDRELFKSRLRARLSDHFASAFSK